MNTLQIIVIAAAVVLAITALLIFSGVLPGFRQTSPAESGEVSFWGTMPKELAGLLISDFNKRFQNIKVNYREVPEGAYIAELLNALASGAGPDVFILPQEQIFKHKDKIYALDSSVYPARAFKDNFLASSEIFISQEGIIGLPFQIDPLVLYWNRDLFRNAGLAKTPSTWSEFSETSNKLKTVQPQKIITAGSALGEFSNNRNAKDILALLMLQTGNKIVDQETLRPVFGDRGAVLSPAEEALLFFISFADPRKGTYTWSKSQPEAVEAFASGRLAMHLGYATEIEKILALNPHLNFDVAEVPQISGSKIQGTFGKTSALVVAKQSQNRAAALTFIYDLTSPKEQNIVAQNFYGAPALKSVLAVAQKDPVLEIFYRSAVKSLSWLDPDPEQTLAIWKEMSENALSGTKRINQAVSDAQRKFETLMPGEN